MKGYVTAAEGREYLTADWRKLCVNSAGAISALVAKPSGVLQQDEALGKVALEIVAECVANPAQT
jgi:2-dehydropantoate 2-reductase